ncbi:MAG: hypothetical protein U0X91_20735 [Spirosomataceae bacterium]
MNIFFKKIVDAVQNKDGVFEQTEPDFAVSFDFNESNLGGGVKEVYNVPLSSFARGGIIRERPVLPQERPPLQKIDMNIHQDFIEALRKTTSFNA